MAINYNKVGWDTTKYFNPSNMNHMDDGIKAACDKADANEKAIEQANSNLIKFSDINLNSLLSNVNFSQGESKEIGNFEEITGISPSRVVSLFTFNVTTNIATIHGATIYNDMLYFGVAKECTVYSGFLRVAYK